MITVVTVDDVNTTLGDDWADEAKKPRSVLSANVWLGNVIDLSQFLDRSTKTYVFPDDVKTAGAYAASAAANGGLYTQSDGTGVATSESVKAGSVEVSTSYSESTANASAMLDSDLQLAIALLGQYGYSSNQIRVRRG